MEGADVKEQRQILPEETDREPLCLVRDDLECQALLAASIASPEPSCPNTKACGQWADSADWSSDTPTPPAQDNKDQKDQHEPGTSRGPSFHYLLRVLADDMHDLLKSLADQGENVAARSRDLHVENELLQERLRDLTGEQPLGHPRGAEMHRGIAANQDESHQHTPSCLESSSSKLAQKRDSIETSIQTESLEKAPWEIIDKYEIREIFKDIRQEHIQTLAELRDAHAAFQEQVVGIQAMSDPFPEEAALELEEECLMEDAIEGNGKEASGHSDINTTPQKRQSRQSGVSGVSDEFAGIGTAQRTKMLARSRNEFGVDLCTFLNEDGDVIEPSDNIDLIRPFIRRCAKCSSEDSNKSEQLPETPFAVFIHSMRFKLLAMVVIVLNFTVMIWETEWRSTHLGQEQGIFFFLSFVFTAFYVFECGSQLYVDGLEYFYSEDYAWNWFDLIVVTTSVIDILVKAFGGSAIRLGFLRTLRFLRISKLLRMFQALRIFKEIRIMVDMLAGSFTFFVWCLIMLALFLSLFAIFFVQGATSYLEGDDVDVDELTLENIRQFFGSVPLAILHLFMASTGGNDWEQYYSTVKHFGVVYEILFVFYILFSVIAFFNVISGVFCEKAMALAKPTMPELMEMAEDKNIADAAELSILLNRHVDHDGTFELDKRQFEEFLMNKDVETYFEVRGLSVASAKRFFGFLAKVLGTDVIKFGLLISAAVKLDGTASSIDLHVLHIEIKALQLAHKQIKDDLRLLNLAE